VASDRTNSVFVVLQTPVTSAPIRDPGKSRPGQRVLIIGAGGGVGTFALQRAKA
jgi:NADPH:quinone reductase-like Zn-dependent oxidoreductase